MIIFYFSGTGNSKYLAETFADEMNAQCHSIEEDVDFEALISENETVAFCYPIYVSRVPRIMRDFAIRHTDGLKNKNVIIFCTQQYFSGDGARSFAALFPKNHINVIYAEHFFMPSNVGNILLWPMASDKGAERSVLRAKRKMKTVCGDIKNGKIKKRGFNIISQALGLMQGAFLSFVEQKANKHIGITKDCTNCGVCVKICPMNNLIQENGRTAHKHDCTMCYRCVNNCPHKAITAVFHGKVRKQYKGPRGIMNK